LLVAITRAQALLIIVGNPLVLGLDPLWRALLNYIRTEGGWRGREIEWDPTESVQSGGYDQQIRQRAEGEAYDMISRLKSFIVENTEGLTSLDQDSGTHSDDDRYMDGGLCREEE
jgi:helicase MOV-10